MLRNFFLFITLFIWFNSGFAQSILRGKISDELTKKPLPSVSVYLNNTTIGTISDEKGLFLLKNIPQGKITLIASSIGYENYVKIIDTRSQSKEFIILLKPKSEELGNFSVLPPEANGWEKWGKIFTDIFIGTVPMRANNCKIVNPDIIKFRLTADNTLTAFAKEPLIIMNYALGYEIRYKLEEFEYDFNTKLINYSGYALFEDMGLAHPKRAERYKKERLATYTGSLLHFMRTFYANDLETQGFELKSLGYISNPRKDRAKRLFALHKDSILLDTTGLWMNIQNSSRGYYIEAVLEKTQDSSDVYKKMLLEPDSVISHQIISGDSIGFAVDSTVAGLYFSDSLEVSYKLKEIPNRYRSLSKEHKKETYPISQFVFVYKRPVFVLANGYYYKPYDVKITGYWAWSECISTRLPYDYKPY